jgi:hypothetical protein
VAQTMYTYVSKCKNDKIKERKTRVVGSAIMQPDRMGYFHARLFAFYFESNGDPQTDIKW